MAEEVRQQQKEPTRYGAWLQEKQQKQAARFETVSASGQPEVELEDDREEDEEPMVREREPKRTMGIRVDPDVYDEFEREAELDGVTVSELLRNLLVEHSSNSPERKRKILIEALRKAVVGLRALAAEEGPRVVARRDITGLFVTKESQPHEAQVLAGKIEQFIEKSLAQSKPRGR